MSAIPAEPPPPRLQPSLFADLPETARARPLRRARSAAAPPCAALAEPPAPAPPPLFIPSPALPAPPDPAEMSQAELRALTAALPDAKLAFLLLESARETRRRVAPSAVDLDFEAGDTPPAEPNPALLRAAATAAGELSGEDDAGGGYAAARSPNKRSGGRSR